MGFWSTVGGAAAGGLLGGPMGAQLGGLIGSGGGSLSGGLDNLGEFIFGESPDSVQQRRIKELQEQYGIGGPGQLSDFQLGGLGAQSNQLGALSSQLGNRGPSQFQGDQRFILNQLRGELGPGGGVGAQLANRQAQMGAQSGIQNQLAQLAGQRGGGSPLAARTAAMNSANLSAQAGQQGMMGALGARQAALGQYGGVANAARQGDIAEQGMNDRARFAALQQQLARQQMQQQAMQALQGNTLQRAGLFMPGTQPGTTSRQQLLGFGMGIGEMFAGNPMGAQKAMGSAGGPSVGYSSNGIGSPVGVIPQSFYG